MSRKSRRTVKPSRGLTLDTGFLIALERRKTRAEKVLALYERDAVTVPAVVLAEWWRGSRRQRELRGFFVIEEIDEQLAELAGLALAHIPQPYKPPPSPCKAGDADTCATLGVLDRPIHGRRNAKLARRAARARSAQR